MLAKQLMCVIAALPLTGKREEGKEKEESWVTELIKLGTKKSAGVLDSATARAIWAIAAVIFIIKTMDFVFWVLRKEDKR